MEDRRDVQVNRPMVAGGILGLLPTLIRFLGFKKVVVGVALVGVVAYFTGGVDNVVNTFLGSSHVSQTKVPLQQTPAERELAEFSSVILADTEQTWTHLFAQRGGTYREPKLVLFRDAVESACGLADTAVGPFYCPRDQQIYLDLGFFEQLKRQLNAPGDFAQAYVIAHEVGHHVQKLLGIADKVRDLQQRSGSTDANKLSVLLELQADCLAGVWGHHAGRGRQLLESGDIEEGLNAASAIGDDRLQRQSRGVVRPDAFTHGSSAQRVQWFKTGLDRGDISACNTFQAP